MPDDEHRESAFGQGNSASTRVPNLSPRPKQNRHGDAQIKRAVNGPEECGQLRRMDAEQMSEQPHDANQLDDGEDPMRNSLAIAKPISCADRSAQ